MVRGGLVALVVLLALPAADADFLQWQGGAERSGVVGSGGPVPIADQLDIAYVGSLDPPPLAHLTPLIIDRNLLYAAWDGERGTLQRMDLDSMEQTELAQIGYAHGSPVSDGTTVYVPSETGVHAVRIDTGGRPWEPAAFTHGVPLPSTWPDPNVAIPVCGNPALDDGRMIFACSGGRTTVTVPHADGSFRLYVVDTATGSVEETPMTTPGPEFTSSGGPGALAHAIVRGDGFIAVPVHKESSYPYTERTTFELFADDGEQFTFTPSVPAGAWSSPEGQATVSATQFVRPMVASAWGTGMIALGAALYGIQDAPSANDEWRVFTLDSDDRRLFEVAVAMAVWDDVAWIVQEESIVSVDLTNLAVGPRLPTPSTRPVHVPSQTQGTLLVAGGILYFLTYEGALADSPVSLEVFDPQGARAIQPAFVPVSDGPAHAMLTVADGLAVVTSPYGHLLVAGQTAQSPMIGLVVESPYVAAGETFSIDVIVVAGLSTDYGAVIDWGDDTQREAATDGLNTHVYDRNGEYVITVFVDNAAGQKATRQVEVQIGLTPARAPTFLESRFAPENQETTFFVLGLLVTLVAGLVAAARVARKRSRLRRELAAADYEAGRLAGNPLALHRAMVERQEHAKTLLVAGRLDEAQYAVLKGHIDAVAAGGRLESIEQDFPFLPVSLAGTLQRMLDDGRITKWERSSFLEALGSDDVLTKSQKAKVARRIEAWFAEDS